MNTNRRLKIVYIYNRERDARWRRYQAGQGPDEFMYGYNHFDPTLFEMSFIAKDLAEWDWRRVLWEPLERAVAWRLKMGFSLHVAWENMEELRRADVIVSTVDAVGLPIAALKAWGKLTTPLMYFSQGLSDRLEALKPWWLRQIFQQHYGHYLATCERILVLGEGAVAPLRQQFAHHALSVAAIPFGVDTTFWQPAENQTTQDYFLSVGSDKGRDYPTLLHALADQPVKVVTFQTLPAKLLRKNVLVRSDYSDTQLRRLYQEATAVVIPLKDIAQPSGQSATLQAMACGKAVILSKTRGLWEPSVMRHLDNCYLVPPGDITAIRAAALHLKNNPALAKQIGQRARSTVAARYSSRQFAEAITSQIEAVLRKPIATAKAF